MKRQFAVFFLLVCTVCTLPAVAQNWALGEVTTVLPLFRFGSESLLQFNVGICAGILLPAKGFAISLEGPNLSKKWGTYHAQWTSGPFYETEDLSDGTHVTKVTGELSGYFKQVVPPSMPKQPPVIHHVKAFFSDTIDDAGDTNTAYGCGGVDIIFFPN